MKLNRPAKEVAERSLFSGQQLGQRFFVAGGIIMRISGRRVFVPLDEVAAQRRRPRQRQPQRSQQRYAQSHRQSAKESASHSGNRNQRQKNYDRSNGGTDERDSNLMQCAMDSLEPALSGITMQHNVLDP